jgi:aspartate racemase
MKHKHIGIVGGLSPSSTSEYYDRICKRFNEKAGGLNYPDLTIRSINLQEIADLLNANRWDDVADRMIDAIKSLKSAGADFAAIATNTPHNAYERISKLSPLYVLSIMDATANKIKEDGFSRVGLLGTKPTMEYGFFQRTFSEYGIETVIPDDEDREHINNVIWNELVYGNIREESKAKYLGIISKMQNIQGVILGCTEIPLLVKPEDCPLKIYDTATIHADAILEYALQG